MAAKTFTPKEVATDLNTDGKTLRKFLRSTFPESAPGKGNRWALTSKQVREVKKEFAKWDESRKASAADPEVPTGDPQEQDSSDAQEDTQEELDAMDEVTEIDLDLDEEPTDAELETIDDSDEEVDLDDDGDPVELDAD